MTWAPPQNVGDTDPTISDAKAKLARYSYGKAANDGTDTYTAAFHDALITFAHNRNEQIARGQVKGPVVNTVGIYDWAMKTQLGTLPAPSTPPPPSRPNVWLYTAPGSGANWDQGPSFDMGEWAKEALGINHQPLSFQKGGYLGLMGGDPGFSYNEVIYDEYKSLEYNLEHNPKIHIADDGTVTCDSDLILIFSGYSQSADGMEDALEILFGDGGFVPPATGVAVGPGRFRAIRDHVKGVINFGNPSRENPGMTGVPGYQPAGTGISLKKRPKWLHDLIVSITRTGDFYACTTDTIRPPFYKIIVEADFSLPFFVHVLKVGMGVFENFLPIFGGILGPLAPVIVGGATGLTGLMPLLTGMMGQAAGGAPTDGDAALDAELEKLLSVQGILTHFPDLIALIGSLNGIAIHGDYQFAGSPEFGGRNGVQVGCDVLRGLVGA